MTELIPTPEVVSTPDRVVLVPGALALLPAYAAQRDPLGALRTAALTAVTALPAEVDVIATPQGARVAEHLLAATAGARRGAGRGLLVVGNGSAKRTEKAPGHLDERAHAFDDAVRAWLHGDGEAPEAGLGEELWAEVDPLLAAAKLVSWAPARVAYDDDPYGVQYWVMTWDGLSPR
ncbi:hypothetical protein [Nocardioides sp.]|uniref:hypothetical protein n=1 Tax=Nocardioides sp. TaxID=35761 RepID=UPI003512D080